MIPSTCNPQTLGHIWTARSFLGQHRPDTDYNGIEEAKTSALESPRSTLHTLVEWVWFVFATPSGLKRHRDEEGKGDDDRRRFRNRDYERLRHVSLNKSVRGHKWRPPTPFPPAYMVRKTVNRREHSQRQGIMMVVVMIRPFIPILELGVFSRFLKQIIDLSLLTVPVILESGL
jgi:hypothetical protein